MGDPPPAIRLTPEKHGGNERGIWSRGGVNRMTEVDGGRIVAQFDEKIVALTVENGTVWAELESGLVVPIVGSTDVE